MSNNKRQRPKRKYTRKIKLRKLTRTLADSVMGSDATHLIGELELFLQSGTWKLIQGMLAEEAFTQEAAMRTFVRKSGLSCESSYACGSTEAFEHVSNAMIKQFIETLKTGKPAGVVEDDRSEEELPNDEGQIRNGEQNGRN